MNKKTKITVISVAAVLLAAGITVGIISLSKRDKTPNQPADSVASQEGGVYQKMVSTAPPEESESGGGQNDDSQSGGTGYSEEVNLSDYQHIADASACFYYLNFLSADAISDRDCLDALEALTTEQDARGDQRFVPVTRGDNMTNILPVSVAQEVIFELFGRENSSMLDRLSSDGQNVEFMAAGGIGAPTAVVLSAEPISDTQTKLLIKYSQENVMGDVTVNQSAYLTVEKINGRYFNHRIISFTKLDG